MVETFTKHRKTHNGAVFDAIPTTSAAAAARILTGLPDAYGRGRIIGYRRVALCGVDRLITRKKEEQRPSTRVVHRRDHPGPRTAEQTRALGELKEMAAKYGFDISSRATAKEAVQWLFRPRRA